MKKKSLIAKKVIHKSFNFKEIFKDRKIFEIYKTFIKNFEYSDKSKKIAISVSGGPDSMALCFLVSSYKSLNNNKINPIFFIVDHGLRKNSTTEALQVKKHLKLKKINLNILKWKGKKPNSNLQSLARQKRYSLLFNECQKNNIKTILTGHHQDDLYETFFSRLLRGSGSEGLSSFSKNKKTFMFKGQKIEVIRPLINLTKDDLIYVAKNVFNFFVDDPSNKMEKFQRVRLRNLIKNLKNQGLDFNKLKLTINNLASTNKAINEIVKNNIAKNVNFIKDKYLINSEFFLKPEEIVFRSLCNLIITINKNDYPPRGKKMINLIRSIKSKDQFKATLGGTIIQKMHNSVILRAEKTKKL